ncbi:leucine-zipper-like transcriptional regulator 1 [Salvia divinorum]|uniref:Leucine-zipper-like transcriptional regulator 1 n=1 Tax=Salvia divinorum TaxID=28513 RepID=A0ABD1FM20_SALDI
MVMRWERVEANGGNGPGARRGHTCNAVEGGKRLYVFGGCGNDQRYTNRVQVLDTVKMVWSEPRVKGEPPIPRDSHSCTTVGDDLFVFGGTDGEKPLNDLHILETSSNTWIVPKVRGRAPKPRSDHSAAFVGKKLFIFGGCGKHDEEYNDLHTLDTGTLSWKWTRVFPVGTRRPCKRNSHTCTAWENKIIIIGGHDSSGTCISDVHILDTDTLRWSKLKTTGPPLPPRAGHTSICLGKSLFVFAGFSTEWNLYNDIRMLNIETGAWTDVWTVGPSPSDRLCLAGDSLDPAMRDVLVFLGGCKKDNFVLDDMYFLHTGPRILRTTFLMMNCMMWKFYRAKRSHNFEAEMLVFADESSSGPNSCMLFNY